MLMWAVLQGKRRAGKNEEKERKSFIFFRGENFKKPDKTNFDLPQLPNSGPNEEPYHEKWLKTINSL